MVGSDLTILLPLCGALNLGFFGLGVGILADIDIPLQRHAGDIERFANVLNGRGFVGVELFHQNDLFGGEGFSPTAAAPPGSGSGKTGLGTLTDDVALELGKGAEDVEDELPAAGRGVDLLGKALEADALAVKPRDRLDQVCEGATEPIQAPHHQGVPVPQVRERIRQARAFCSAATDGVGEGFRAAGVLEGVALEIKCLICRGDSGVSDEHMMIGVRFRRLPAAPVASVPCV
jgi:hypothetical protein